VTEIERKALALLRECAEVPAYVNLQAIPGFVRAALFRAIEQHEAYKREVSRMVVYLKALYPTMPTIYDSFIIAKPVDPLVEAMQEMIWSGCRDVDANTFRAVIEKRGGKIVWGEG